MGYWSYSELKDYGQPRKPVTLPQVFKGKARDRIIGRVMDVLDDWRASQFEHEGAMVAGFRSALCLNGFSWARSDQEARAIVNEGLRRNGAVRPTWEQGQREYTTAREDCLWCHRPIDEDDRAGKRDPRYCSPVCARSALENRYQDSKWWRDNKGWAAYRLLTRQAMPERECKQCGAMFRIERKGSTTAYCSHKCHELSRRTIPERPCKHCGTVFRPEYGNGSQKYCSMSCFDQSKVVGHARRCLECGTTFQAKTERADYCCKVHNTRAFKRAKRAGTCARPENIIYLTPKIFDEWFKVAA